MKAEMLLSLNRRYVGVETEDIYALATISNPRFEFKDKFFSSVTDKASVVCVLKVMVNEMSAAAFISTECEEPPPKKAKTAVFTSLFEILEEVEATVSDSRSSLAKVDKYLSEPLIPFHQSNSCT